MIQNNLIQFLNSNDLIKIIPFLQEENIFYFKSKDNNLSFLAWGEFKNATGPINDPQFILGNFEKNHQYKKANNFILINNDHLTTQINAELKLDLNLDIHKKSHSIKGQIESPTKADWNLMIDESIKLMNDKVLDKIVLSRNLNIEFNQFNCPLFLNSLLEKNEFANNSYFIFYKTSDSFFVSLTPEQLFKINDRELQTMSLAGSMPNGIDEDENDNNEHILLNDHKLIQEHEIVSIEIKKRLEQISKNITQSPLSILKLNYIQHRMHLFKAKLEDKVNVFDVINTMHPTPAVGGMPTKAACKVIHDLEKSDRNYYAAPFGIITKNMSEVAVALRSASFYNNTLIIHAGCGLTKDSQAESEWNETANKMKPILLGLKK